MTRLGLLVVAVIFVAACSSTTTPSTSSDFGPSSENLAFVDGEHSIAQALIADTLVADAEGARCVAARLDAQFDLDDKQHVRQTGSLRELGLSTSEAAQLSDALFDCTDPRDGVIVGMHAAGLDPIRAACIGNTLDSEIYAAAITHSFSDGTMPGFEAFAADLDRATRACE